MTRDLMTRIALTTLMAALFVGCNRKEPATTQDERPGPAIADSDTSTGTPGDMPADALNGDNGPAPVIGGDHATDPPLPRDDPPRDHPPRDERPLARSPFPDEGENRGSHIAPNRLSDHDPFENLIDPEDLPAIVPWEQAGDYVGYEITVEGRIVALGQSRDGGVNFLNFHRDYRGKFYMVIFKDLADTLDQPLSELFEGKLVRVLGTVGTHRGRPQIRITAMDQVEFVEE